MIRLQAIGNLGKDAITNQVNGRNVINFTVAHTERYKDGGGNMQERTTWLDCSYWTDRTAVAPYLKKGKQVYVEGTPDVRSYTRQDGSHGTVLTVRVTSVQLLGGSDSNDNGGDQQYAAQAAKPSGTMSGKMTDDAPADDLPF